MTAPPRHLPKTGTNTALRLRVLGPTDPALDDVYAFERRSFECEYDVPPAVHDAEFGPYHARSIFAAVTDAHERVVGMMRLILPGPDPSTEPIKTFVEAALAPWHLDVERAVRLSGIDVRHTWDVATLSVDRSIGRLRVTALGALYHALVNLTDRNDVRYLTMTVDERVRSTLRMVGLPTTALAGARPQPFEGSAASTPAWGNCADMLSHQRRHHPDAHRLVRLGVGLADVDLPPADSYLIAASPGARTVTTGARTPVVAIAEPPPLAVVR